MACVLSKCMGFRTTQHKCSCIEYENVQTDECVAVGERVFDVWFYTDNRSHTYDGFQFSTPFFASNKNPIILTYKFLKMDLPLMNLRWFGDEVSCCASMSHILRLRCWSRIPWAEHDVRCRLKRNCDWFGMAHNMLLYVRFNTHPHTCEHHECFGSCFFTDVYRGMRATYKHVNEYML